MRTRRGRVIAGGLLAPWVLAVIPMARKTSANSINELAIERSAARVPDIAS
jgi:hypothetical protein